MAPTVDAAEKIRWKGGPGPSACSYTIGYSKSQETRHALVSYRKHDPDSDVLTDLPKVTLLGIRHGRDGQMRVSYNLVCVSTTFMKEGGHFCKLTTKETQATQSTHYCTISLGCFSMQLEGFTCVALHKSMDINASC